MTRCRRHFIQISKWAPPWQLWPCEIVSHARRHIKSELCMIFYISNSIIFWYVVMTAWILTNIYEHKTTHIIGRFCNIHHIINTIYRTDFERGITSTLNINTGNIHVLNTCVIHILSICSFLRNLLMTNNFLCVLDVRFLICCTNEKLLYMVTPKQS